MQQKDCLTLSFREALQTIRHAPLYRHPSSFLWQRSLSIRSQFCEAVVASGLLTFGQMVNAACRYCLGATRSRGVIYWQIDQEGRIHDGKVMWYAADCHRLKDLAHRPTWVSYLLARRQQQPKGTHTASHCFFGTHLLASPHTVCIVEAEKSAVILSEWYPEHVWLAAGGLGEVQLEKFRPLRGRRVILFPDTDSEGIAYRRWYEAARLVMQQPFWEGSPPIYVSSYLELHATAEQKQQKIDLVDILFAP